MLGIKYEAARVGGVDEASLASIVDQIRIEVGEDWESNVLVLRGRNAVRDEHGLPKIGEPARQPPKESVRRPLWKRLLGGHSA